MTATIVDGNAMAKVVLDGVRAQAEALGVPLQLAAVCWEGDAALASFVKLKQKAAQSVGIEFSSYFVDSEQHARETLTYLADDPDVQGILLELPVPESWNRDALLRLIPVAKDVDALAPDSEALFERGEASVLPPAVMALQHVIDAMGVQVAGAEAVVVGAGQLVGRPIARWLERQGAHVRIVDVDTADPSSTTATADIVVCGAGSPALVTASWVKEGAAVFDFGFHDGKGDVDAPTVEKKAAVLARVPGGMGPLVVAAVFENLLTLATQ